LRVDLSIAKLEIGAVDRLDGRVSEIGVNSLLNRIRSWSKLKRYQLTRGRRLAGERFSSAPPTVTNAPTRKPITLPTTPRPTIRPTTPPTSVLKGDWEFCSKSSECANGCCSRTYSDNGKLKCTPLTGGYRPDIYV
jgi:hypothetical protein